MATAAATAITPAHRAAMARMAAVAESRALQVFGPSSYVVPQADPGTPVWCVSSASRAGAFHVVWLQTSAEGIQRIMCSCPARSRRNVWTCSHAQAVRLQLAAQCAARASRPAAAARPAVESAASAESPAPASEPAPRPARSGAGLGSALALQRPAFERPDYRLTDDLIADLRRQSAARRAADEQACRRAVTFEIDVVTDAGADAEESPEVPADAIESLNQWHDARAAETRQALDESEPEPEPEPEESEPAPAAAAAAEPEESKPQPANMAHCPRCGRAADVDIIAEYGACPACINARPALSHASRARSEEEKAAMRRRIIAAERERQSRIRREGRGTNDDDDRRDDRRREHARRAKAKRDELRESDAADHERAILYRDNGPISPFRR
jgi:hypothetical protein